MRRSVDLGRLRKQRVTQAIVDDMAVLHPVVGDNQESEQKSETVISMPTTSSILRPTKLTVYRGTLTFTAKSLLTLLSSQRVFFIRRIGCRNGHRRLHGRLRRLVPGSCLPQFRGNLRDRNITRRAARARHQLHLAVGGFFAHRHAERDANQVRVLELYACALVSVVEQNRQSQLRPIGAAWPRQPSSKPRLRLP